MLSADIFIYQTLWYMYTYSPKNHRGQCWSLVSKADR